MMERYATSCTGLLELIFQHPPGSNGFTTLLATSLLVGCGILYVLTGIVGGRSRVLAVLIAALMPLSAGVAGYVLTEIHLVPLLGFSWVPVCLPWAGFGLLFLSVLLLVSRKVLGLGKLMILVYFAVAAAGAGMAMYGAEQLLELVDRSGPRSQQTMTRAIGSIDA